MNIDYSPEFVRCFKKLSRELKIKTLEKEKIFRKNQFDPRLKTHKLSGKLVGRYAFWIDFKNRIIFSFVNKKLIYFLSIGSHDIYK
ncbi:MAG: type II toxin-antitoxin system mRNA interferase toxin, RelE/StbE family [Candidatus Paceibacterota bacterium]|jgi:mRNA-degrading endonuclease YafQ of YafQ-DinJ toxin-antitoxin module